MLWGVFYGGILIFEKFFLLNRLQKAPVLVRRLYTLLCVMVGWVLFAFEDIGKGWAFLKVMFGGAALCSSTAMYQLLSYLPLLTLCAVAATPLGKRIYHRFSDQCGARLGAAVEVAGLALTAVLAVAFLISGSYKPFLYFRF